MAALIPALIKLFMSRARGGGGSGGGGAGGGGAPKSDYDKDNEYWKKQGMSLSDSEDALAAAMKNRSKPMTWDEAQQKAKAGGQ
jgi:hypothetical protein